VPTPDVELPLLKTPLGRLRVIGFVEGLSFLILLGIAMPLKHFAGMPLAVTIVGAAHGGLWILMLLAVADVAWRRSWPAKRIAGAVLASVVPGGPFVLDYLVLKPKANEASRLDAVAEEIVS
jgi:integral membrane protein